MRACLETTYQVLFKILHAFQPKTLYGSLRSNFIEPKNKDEHGHFHLKVIMIKEEEERFQTVL